MKKKRSRKVLAREREMKQKENEDKEILSEHKRNLINAIELERKNNELTKIRLVQLHEHYGKMLTTLRGETKSLQKTIKILQSDLTQNDLKAVQAQNEGLKMQLEQQRAFRIQDEQQLKKTNQENQKLVIIVHYLKEQLQTLMTQYQMLCHQKDKADHKKKGRKGRRKGSEAEKIVNKLDSLDIVDAEHMVHHQAQQQGHGHGHGGQRPLSSSSSTSSYLMAQSVEGDPWFDKMKDENQMLERHIRTLRHIIERETQRCNFKEIIVGKSIHSPKKDKVTKDAKDSDTA